MSEVSEADLIDVKALRKRIGWDQKRLARYMDVDQSTISRMERSGDLKGPARRLLQVLAEAADGGSADSLCPEAGVGS